MEFDVKIYQLSSDFQKDYPTGRYPELMCKKGRPYSCLLVDLHQDYFICIPYRSSIQHNNAFLFRGTQRSRRTRSGLDYSKIVLISDERYFDQAKAVVDQDEYTETLKNIKRIVGEAVDYVDTYINHVTGKGRCICESISENISIRHFRIFTTLWVSDEKETAPAVSFL